MLLKYRKFEIPEEPDSKMQVDVYKARAVTNLKKIVGNVINQDNRFAENMVRQNGIVDITSIQCNSAISVVNIFYDVMFLKPLSNEEKAKRFDLIATYFTKV